MGDAVVAMKEEEGLVGAGYGLHAGRLKGVRIALLVTQWYEEIMASLQAAALKQLACYGLKPVGVHAVPGSFELPLAAAWLVGRSDVDAVVAMGCVIRGKTPHFDYVCRAVTDGLAQTALAYRKPIGFGVITADTLAQAHARSSSKHNKGREATAAVLSMLCLGAQLSRMPEGSLRAQ